ncbi:MAG: hypothetical protein IJG13_14160 [Kiritimatiellae bacterium]|nr:hypothetical protein [Kiritimatiellia bacterium]
MRMRRGQVALYLLLALVAIMVLVLGNVGAFVAVRAKNRAMNAGDAAALAAAHRQAELLNEIGKLNLRHAEADAVGDWEQSREIVRKQRRLAFLGPVDCLRAANAAARANGAQADPGMAGIIRRHTADIRSLYLSNPDLYPEPWEGAWEEYAAALDAIVSEGVAAGCDNVDFADAVSCFPLTSKSFYSMVAGRSWCKLVVARWEWLLDCDSHNMPRPTAKENVAIVNSEFCSLDLAVAPLVLREDEQEAFRALLSLNGASFPPRQETPFEDNRPLDDISRLYFFYNTENGPWREWVELDPQGKFALPVVGKAKPEFDVLGCTAVFRVTGAMPNVLSGTVGRTSWNAAAKPFGRIQTSSGLDSVLAPEARGLVLPAYEAVRLVPVGAATVDGQDLSTADEEWLNHVRDHVPAYCADGLGGLHHGCSYCAVLEKWEDPEFRAAAAAWISANAETCRRGSGGGGPAGGTSYAH